MKFYEMILFLIAFGGALLFLEQLVLFGVPVAPIIKSWFGGLLIILMCAAYVRIAMYHDLEDEEDGSLQ